MVLGTRQVTMKLLVYIGVYRMLNGEQINIFRDKQKYASMMRLALLHVLYILSRLIRCDWSI